MLTIKTVSVHYGRKANLGDYNSANIECTLWADVTEDEDLDQAMNALWTMAKENVKAQLLPLVKNGGSMNMQAAFLGLPIKQDIPVYEPAEESA